MQLTHQLHLAFLWHANLFVRSIEILFESIREFEVHLRQNRSHRYIRLNASQPFHAIVFLFETEHALLHLLLDETEFFL